MNVYYSLRNGQTKMCRKVRMVGPCACRVESYTHFFQPQHMLAKIPGDAARAGYWKSIP